MQRGVNNLSKIKGLSVAIGKFDGLHLGHMKVINSAIQKRDDDTDVAVIIIDNKSKEKLLTDSEKKEMIYNAGADEVITLNLDEIKDFSPEQFVRDILRDRLNVKTISVGFNFKFGKNASGDSALLKKIAEKIGIAVDVIEPVKIDYKIVSKTAIKDYLQRGKIEEANAMLGYNYSLTSEVVTGNKKGKELGYPTINQIPDDEKIIPKYGVYGSRVFVDDKWEDSITNVGIHPTIANGKLQFETHMFNRDDDLYGEILKVELLNFLRREQKFDTVKELIEQMKLDVTRQKQKNSLHLD
jgi:riboflavin kinase/FMN adenylyltransferase